MSDVTILLTVTAVCSLASAVASAVLSGRASKVLLPLAGVAGEALRSKEFDVLRAKLDLHEKALENFWKLVGEQFASKTELAAVEKRCAAMTAAGVATGRPKFITRAM
jgi:hypothetical protein